MGRDGSLIQSLHDPTYSRAGGRPASSMAKASWQAVTPLPQETMGDMYELYNSYNSRGGRNRCAAVRLAAKGAFSAPGMWPAFLSIGSISPRYLSGPRASR